MEPKYAANATVFSLLRLHNGRVPQEIVDDELNKSMHEHLFTRETDLTPYSVVRDLCLEGEIKKVKNEGVIYYVTPV